MSERLFDKRLDKFFRTENVIFERGDLDVYEKVVYILLCRYANNNNGAFPSYETIANGCSISRRKTISVIKSLIEKNLVEKEERVKAGTNENNSNIYYVLTCEFKKEGSAQHAPPSECHAPPSAQHAPNKELYKKNHNKNKSSIRTRPDDETSCEMFFDRFKKLTKAEINKKSVRILLKKYSIEDLFYELDIFLDKTKHQELKNITGAFISYLKGDFTPAIKQDNKLSNKDNFTERKYDSDDFEVYYKKYDE